jgi:hypothetical protein
MVLLRVIEIAEKKGLGMGKLSRTADVSYKAVKWIYDDILQSNSHYTWEAC